MDRVESQTFVQLFSAVEAMEERLERLEESKSLSQLFKLQERMDELDQKMDWTKESHRSLRGKDVELEERVSSLEVQLRESVRQVDTQSETILELVKRLPQKDLLSTPQMSKRDPGKDWVFAHPKGLKIDGINVMEGRRENTDWKRYAEVVKVPSAEIPGFKWEWKDPANSPPG